MQVEGCVAHTNPFTKSPSIHLPNMRWEKTLLLGIRTSSLDYTGEHAHAVNTRPIKFWNCVQYLDRNHIFHMSCK